MTSRTRHHLQLVQKNINRMLLLINQVLDFRKIQNKKMGLTIEYRDIIIMLHNIMDNFRLLATEKNINFSLQTTLPSVFLWIDSDKFEKIIFNLLSNAFKYTPDNKSITLIVMESGQFVSIAVKDEGIGISKDKVPSIFERFTTVSKENDMQPSSGIGLSLVNELVKMLHGEIQVESEVKKGSVFKLVLHKGKEIYAQDKNVEYILNDTSEEQETVLAEPEQNDKTSLPDMPPATKETLVKVMVVEDNAELRQFICEILSGTYRVVGVADGVMALEKIEEEIPDFIITDIMMPRMDGIRMTMKLREKYDFPVIMLSAKSEEVDKITGLNIGADDYVTKPFNPLELVARVKSQLRRYTTLSSTPSGDAVYEAGGLVINDELKKVTVDGEEVKLTPIEYNILLLLMKNKGKVFSISQIYEEIWNEEAIGADNTVAVHIRHIREKIEINPKEPRYLKVVWGVGYKIEAGA